MENTRATTARICVFGKATDPNWIDHVAASLGAGVELVRIDALTLVDTLRSAQARFPGDNLITLRYDTQLPPYWCERLLRALQTPDVLVASPLDNLDPARSPLAAGECSNAGVGVIDSLCFARSRHLLIDWPRFSTLVSAWRGSALLGVDVSRIGANSIDRALAPLRCLLLDHLYVSDSAQALRGPERERAGGDPQPPSALGELRAQLSAALQAEGSLVEFSRGAAYAGLDALPVVLHVLHGWGGGAERFVRDLAREDSQRHHLLLIARGNSARRTYGETLQLVDAASASPPLRGFVLPDPIASTALTHPLYAAFFVEILRDFGVGTIMVSSVIGHSLDVFRSGLPTLLVGHDFYPLWPMLHSDFGDARLAFDAAQLGIDLASAGQQFEFSERDPVFWSTLRAAYVASARSARAVIVAPSTTMLANLARIEPPLAQLPGHVIPHGLAEWPKLSRAVTARPRTDGRLRLVMLGRVRSGKGANLLRKALPGLRRYAEVFLLGAGAEGEQFFGEADVHVVLDYARDCLPSLLAGIGADAALLLPTVAETFSYTLSELNSLGVPVIATRIGALAERIEDGVTGWLVDQDAATVVSAVAALAAHPAMLSTVKNRIARNQVRSLRDMLADYNRLLSNAAQPLARYLVRQATVDRISAVVRGGELANAHDALNRSLEKTKEQQKELDSRADWGMGLERDVRRARDVIAEQAQSIEARTRWAQESSDREADVRDELQRFAILHAQLHEEFDARARWAQSLDAAVQEARERLATLQGSWSWRLTKPLRFIARGLRGMRMRAAFGLRRTRSAFTRTRGSLASRGAIGTLKRIGDEFNRAAPLAAPNVVAAPTSQFSAFAVPASSAPRVSVIIPVFNKIDYTVACLRSIAAQPDSAALEIIVVDDGSSDATEERLAQIDGLRIVRNASNLGFVGSCNAGAAIAKGTFVYFLNNDTVVNSGWVDGLLRCFADEPQAGLVGAKLVYPDGRLQEAGGIIFNDASGWNYGRFDDPADPRYNFRRECDYCSGAAIMLPRELFERVGGFDQRYAPAYYEDTDLCFSVRAAGLKVFYEPRASVVHFEGITAGTDTGSGIKRHQVINRETFSQKWTKALAQQPAPIDSADKASAAANRNDIGHVLIVDAYTPTPDQDSGSLRMINLMRLLRELGYAVSFLPDNRAHAGSYTQAIQALGVQALYHPFVVDPVAWLRQRGGGLDAIILARHYIAVNYIGAARLYAPQARLIFDTIDLHYLREERAAALENKADLARHAANTKLQELKLMRETDMTLVVSSAEKELLSRELPKARIEVLSNVHEIHGRRATFGERSDLVFVGGFQHPPNVDAVAWFVREVFALVLAELPALKLHVIGSKMPQTIATLASDNVIVHGYVEDIAPFMDRSRLSIAPLRYGAGVKGKINMAMSYGLPVVATAVAVEGMHVRADMDVMVADSAATFAAAVLRAYADEALWNRLSDNGLDNVERHFSFAAARTALAQILPPRRV